MSGYSLSDNEPKIASNMYQALVPNTFFNKPLINLMAKKQIKSIVKKLKTGDGI
jgi:hypothetical protein